MAYFINDTALLQDTDEITKAIDLLDEGKIILFPTDTIWAIGCDATNPEAIKAIFDLKKRPFSKPPVLMASSLEMVRQYVAHVHPRIETLLTYHNRPLTIVYEEGQNVPPEVLGEDGSVAFRIPVDEFCLRLVERFGKPLVATSARIEGAAYPGNFGEISSDIIQGVDWVARYRRQEKKKHLPSVIAKLGEKEELEFLRN